MTRRWSLVWPSFIATSLTFGAVGIRLAPSNGTWTLVYVNASLVLLPFIVAAGSKHRDVFEPVHLFALVFGLFFVLRPILDLSSPGSLFWFGYSLEPTYATALGIGAVGACCFYIGYYIHFGVHLAERFPLAPKQWPVKTLDAFVVTTTVVCVGLFVAFIARSGGLGSLAGILSGRTAARASALAGTSGYLYSSPLGLLAVGVLILAVAKSWWSGRALIGFGLISFSQILAASGGDRSWLLPAVAAVGITAYLRRGTRPSLAALCAFAVIVLIFGVTIPREFRTEYDRADATLVGSATSWEDGFLELVGGADAAMAPNLALELLFVPSRVPYEKGTTYLEALSRPIPRSLFPDKPPGAEAKLTEVALPALAAAGVGIAFSFFGEPYLNFGFVGVALVSILFGVLARGLYAWYRRDPTNSTAIAFFALSWPFIFVYMRGGFGSDYQRQVIVLFPLLCLLALTRRARRARSGETGYHA